MGILSYRLGIHENSPLYRVGSRRSRRTDPRSRAVWLKRANVRCDIFCVRRNCAVSSVLLPPSVARMGPSLARLGRLWQFGEITTSVFFPQPLASADRDFFIDGLQRKLSLPEAESCEGPLTDPECLIALRSMALGKSRGVDGLPAEFYVKFWAVFGSNLVQVLNDCYSAGKLCLSQRSGAAMLLYKKGDILDTANWCPITLLCADYKIAAKALCNRLLVVIASVISPDQSCGIPGRFMGEMSAFSMMCVVTQLIRLSHQLHFPSIKRKHSIGSNGPFSRRSLYKWVLAPHLGSGSPSYTHRSTLRLVLKGHSTQNESGV